MKCSERVLYFEITVNKTPTRRESNAKLWSLGSSKFVSIRVCVCVCVCVRARVVVRNKQDLKKERYLMRQDNTIYKLSMKLYF